MYPLHVLYGVRIPQVRNSCSSAWYIDDKSVVQAEELSYPVVRAEELSYLVVIFILTGFNCSLPITYYSSHMTS